MKKQYEQDRAAANDSGCRSDATDGCGDEAGDTNRSHRSEIASTIVYVDAAPIDRLSANPANHADHRRRRARAALAAQRRFELTQLLVAEWIAQRQAAEAAAQIAREYGLELRVHAAPPDLFEDEYSDHGDHGDRSDTDPTALHAPHSARRAH